MNTRLSAILITVCLLPVVAGFVLYGVAGWRPGAPAHRAWRAATLVAFLVTLGLLAVVVGLSAWAAASVAEDKRILAVIPLAIAVLQAAAAGFLLWRRQPRLLLGWCLGSMAGLTCAVVLAVYLGWIALRSSYGALVAAVFLMAVGPQAVFSAGPLAVLPFAWLWQRWGWRRHTQSPPGA